MRKTIIICDFCMKETANRTMSTTGWKGLGVHACQFCKKEYNEYVAKRDELEHHDRAERMRTERLFSKERADFDRRYNEELNKNHLPDLLTPLERRLSESTEK